jgi:hypothetical protein
MRRPRMTTRRWILTLAVVAIPLSAANRLAQRRACFLARAADHQDTGTKIALDAVRYPGGCPFTFDSLLHGRTASENNLAAENAPRPKAATQKWADEMTRMRRAIAYHAAMQRKYVYAAQRPWLPVASDLPGSDR